MRAMEVIKFFVFAVLSGAFTDLSVLIRAQDQSGFISIDCGIAEGSSYTDEMTDIYYISDANYTSIGVNKNVSSKTNMTGIDKQYHNLRSFPDGTKICYTLKPAAGKNNKYLIRAGFLYGNYDEESKVPKFDLYLGPNWWNTVMLYDASTTYSTEIIHVPLTDYIDLCLVNTGFGAPFISVLELRTLNNNNTYDARTAESLEQYGRVNFGSTTGKTVRFSDDEYDRFWSPFSYEDWKPVSTISAIEAHDSKNRLPSIVMETGVVPINSSTGSIEFFWNRDNPTSQFYLFLYFAELQKLEANQSREFNIYVNGSRYWYGPAVIPAFLQTTIVSNTAALKGTSFTVTINKTVNSTLPPLINAAEIYLVKELLQSETYQDDVDAIINIKSYYKPKKRHWQGDPCEPKIAIWDGLNCTYHGYDPPRIIYLDLSSSGLTGDISPYIANLRMLQYLDLSNNSLMGSVPNFLSQLPYLRVLNLSDNGLSGSVPSELIGRSKNGTLTLNVDKNKLPCSSDCKSKAIVPVVATIVPAFILLLIAVAVFLFFKRRKQGEVDDEHIKTSKLKESQFAYSEIFAITTNLGRSIGKGQFATVYHGYIDDSQVAVKIFSPSIVQVYKQFPSDAKLLTKVHHRNLIAYFGYCDEDTNKALIYEYMTNGNLADILSDRNEHFLSWQERLQVAKDVAQGLEYLHSGCRPPIIHGNLKPKNILLNETFQAKLADFGLSKIFTVEGSAKEYLDPEYYVTNKLTEKSDLYSFGVVLLEIITSRPAMTNNQENVDHIIQWASSLLGRGDIKGIVDSRLQGDYLIDSVWKAVELAMACVSRASIKRPVMTQVVMELNQCLAMEISRRNRSEGTIEMVSVNLGTGVIPEAR